MKRRYGRCNLEALFGVCEIVSGTQMRDLLDDVPVALLPTLFAKMHRIGWAKELTSTIASSYHQGDSYTLSLEGGEHGTWHEGPACRRRFYTYRVGELDTRRRTGEGPSGSLAAKFVPNGIVYLPKDLPQIIEQVIHEITDHQATSDLPQLSLVCKSKSLIIKSLCRFPRMNPFRNHVSP